MESPTPLSGLRFLVVEDHEFQRLALTLLLRRLGAAQVHEAFDGREALAVLRDEARPVDVVVSDLDMPGMDGMAFIRHLGEARSAVSLILISAHERKLLASVATMAEAYGIKLLGVIEKPPTEEALREAVARHFAPGPMPPAPVEAASPEFTTEQIARALRHGEFEPFMQPKLSLHSGQVVGVEALARWRHPQHGILPPSAFIDQMEESGLVDELTWLMFSRCAAFARQWADDGLDVTVSVNLSLRSLHDVNLADRLTDLVTAQGAQPRQIMIEITESAATTDLARALETLARLRVKGFGLSIDDYGTGYSSMQQLARIAFTELKIDRSFVTNAGREESARVILASSLDMARKLGLDAVAEGVETADDWALLRALDCGMAQGYLIARPMQAQAFPAWLRAHAAGAH